MNTAARVLNQGALSRGWVVSLFFARFHFTVCALVIAMLISALSMIYVTHATRSLNASVQQAFTERDRLHVQWGQLMLEKSTWLMQARVQTIAEQRLGMINSDNRSIVTINE